MEAQTGAFNQLQLSRTRSRQEVWRADSDTASRRSSARQSVISVAEQWTKSRRASSDTSRTNASATSLTTRGEEVRRWDGLKRTTSFWEDLRRDPELWFPDGNCLIHFYGRGQSRKGPALRLHREDIEDWGFRSIISKFSSNVLMEEDEDEEEGEEREDEDGGFHTNPKTRGKEEVYIGAPPLLGRDDATKFHITTRNLFAFLYEKPLVGAHLGEALVLMHERLNQYRPDKERNRDDMIEYIEDQGYTEFRDSPDHAMAIMYYAEKLRDTDLWTEAFVHCVGMYDILNTAVEFPTVSRTIGALITRAHLEMTLRLEHAYADLGNFMQDSISSAYPKLPESAIKHMDRFRKFLHDYYVQQHGYWPPPTLQPGADYSVVTKSLLRSMYADLRNLYAFLCDPKSEPKPTQEQMETYKAIYGGICMPAVVSAFDRRFKNTSLPNPLPLLPSGSGSGRVSPITQATNLAAMDLPSSAKPSSGNAFTRFLRPKQRKSTKALNTLNQLSAASNTNDQSVLDSQLVQEYSRFERDWTVRGEEKLDAVEGRKVRWLLIYALLQTVIGVIVVPQEVAATENVEYPLCVQTGGTPPWRKRSRVKAVFDGAATPQLEALSGATSPAQSPYMTPTTPGARSGAASGAITPISAAGDIPPVPQLVLAELEKLQRRSFDSGRSATVSPGPSASNASIRSGKLVKKPKSGLKSSSASIRSERSTRSSFGSMLNRSLYIGPAYGSQFSLASEAPSQATARGSDRTVERAAERSVESPIERPSITKQKSSPAQLEHEPSPARQHRKRGSIFGRIRSRASSIARDEDRSAERNAPAPSLLASPISPTHSTFSHAKESLADTTPATTEFPQATQQAEVNGKAAQSQSSRGQAVPAINTRLEPDRGRALHTPHSPGVTTPNGKKVRNFSRGRSGERSAAAVAAASPVEVPPPVPTASKPRSNASSPARSTRNENKTYTDSSAPPQIPLSTTPLSSPLFDLPPFVNSSTKPNSRPVTPSREVYSPSVETMPLPPPIPFSSKPSSRSNSPAPMRPQTPTAAFRAPAVAESPLSLAQQRPKVVAAQPVQAQPVQAQPVQAQPVQQQQPTYQIQPSQPIQQTYPTQRQEEYRGRSTILEHNGYSPATSEHRSRSRSLALRPSAPAAQARPPMPSAGHERPISNLTESSESARIQGSRSVSPVSDNERSPDTSAEMLQRTVTNNSAYAVQQRQQQSRPAQVTPLRTTQDAPLVFNAVTTPDDSAHTAWVNPQQGSFHHALREHDQKRNQPGRQRRTSSRESKYRRAAWAELGSSTRNEATGMPLPPPAVRQYGAPIVRDAPSKGYGYYNGDEYSEFGSDGSSDEGVRGGANGHGGAKNGLAG